MPIVDPNDKQAALDWFLKQQIQISQTKELVSVMKRCKGDPDHGDFRMSPSGIAWYLAKYLNDMTPQKEVSISGRKFKET